MIMNDYCDGDAFYSMIVMMIMMVVIVIVVGDVI